MATNAERDEERTSVSERMETVRPDELGEETLSFGERLIIAQQIESMRKDIRNGDRLVHDRIGRLEERISALILKNADAIAKNADAIAANSVAIAKNAEGIEGLKALVAINAEGIAENRRAIAALTQRLEDVRVGIKDDVIAANKEERDRSYTRKGWFVGFVAAIVSSGLTVGLTIAAARFGLMSF